MTQTNISTGEYNKERNYGSVRVTASSGQRKDGPTSEWVSSFGGDLKN